MPVKTKKKEAGELVFLRPNHCYLLLPVVFEHLSSLERREEVGFLRKVAR